jgi:hypothetical protein
VEPFDTPVAGGGAAAAPGAPEDVTNPAYLKELLNPEDFFA